MFVCERERESMCVFVCSQRHTVLAIAASVPITTDSFAFGVNTSWHKFQIKLCMDQNLFNVNQKP